MNRLPLGKRENEINLRALIDVLWTGKWVIGSLTVAATTIAIIVSLMIPNIYRSEALLAPNDQDAAGGLSALAAQYGGLASLAGIDLGGGQIDKIALGLEILASRKFIFEFIEQRNLLVPLMAAKGWDAESGELIIDSDEYDVITDTWVRDVRPPKKTIPSLQEAFEEFTDEFLFVGQDRKTGFVTIAVEHYSPVIAQQWVTWLVEDLNRTIMDQDVDEARQAISYLNKQIDATSQAELRTVFYRLIEDQTKTVMLAEVSDEYLLKTLDPALAPEEKAKPRRALIVILSSLMGLVLGTMVVLIQRIVSRAGSANI